MTAKKTSEQVEKSRKIPGVSSDYCVAELQSHPFFKAIDWHLLRLRKLSPLSLQRQDKSMKWIQQILHQNFSFTLYSQAGAGKADDSSLSDSPTFKGFTYEAVQAD